MAANGSFQNSFGSLKWLSTIFQPVNDSGYNQDKDRNVEDRPEQKNIVPTCCHDSFIVIRLA